MNIKLSELILSEDVKFLDLTRQVDKIKDNLVISK